MFDVHVDSSSEWNLNADSTTTPWQKVPPPVAVAGGPAASGVIHTLEKGEMIQSIVDASAEELGEGLFFDIIGFDPRSVGYSTPKLECFPVYLSRQYWSVQGAAAEAIP
jgi:pimeloyl-ACP methyl ester carboxylesterase